MEKKEEVTALSELGEFGLIDRLKQKIRLENKSTALGIGDDAALIRQGGKLTAISTDLLVEGVHFDLIYTPLKHLGYKSIIINLSDLYAMNAIPAQLTVSIAVSNRMSVEALEELYEGIQLACEIYGVDIIGGDTSSSLSGTMISVTAIGEVDEQRVVKRSGAKENDLICVSGDFGAAYAGLQILEREKAVFKKNSKSSIDFSGKDYILERQLKPEARKDIINFFEKENILPTSMIDVSDGLSSELLHLSKSSSVGVQIYENKIPIDPVTVSTLEELNVSPTIAALNGGEDYELLFTLPLEMYEKVKGVKEIRMIGHVTDLNSGNFMVAQGSEQLVPIIAQGWQHK